MNLAIERKADYFPTQLTQFLRTMNAAKRCILFSSISAILALNLLFGALTYQDSAKAGTEDHPYENLEIFARVLEQVREKYVDKEGLTYKSLIQSALKGMLTSLDPHSEFMEPTKYEELRKDTEGAFGGVGIVIELRDDFLTVVAPIDGTPAARAGVLSGDRIVKIEGRNSKRATIQDAVQRLRGKPGTDVAVTIFRPSTGTTKEIRLTRAVIKIRTIKDIHGHPDFELSKDGIGYIRITQFGEKTGDDLQEAIDRLTEQNMEALILDLRGNPGGLLDQAVEVSEKFIQPGRLVVSMRGQKPSMHSMRRARAKNPLLNVPMVVLVNRGSASASEIVAGCLQDWKRAIIIGEKTFGKGSVQSILQQPDGSALRLTTAEYYTPNKRTIHNQGILPDILVPISPEDMEALYYQQYPGGIDNLSHLSEEQRKKIRNTRDEQLARARDILNGIRLYRQRVKDSADKMAKK